MIRFRNLFRNNFVKKIHGKTMTKRNICDKISPEVSVPNLKQTLNYYMKFITPLLDSHELENAKNEISIFEKEEGTILQNYLEDKVKNSEEWREKWANHPYLDFYRDSEIEFTNPSVIHPLSNSFKNENERLEYTAAVILAALDFKISSSHKRELSYVESFYGSCRIPIVNGEEIKFVKNSTNIIVMKNSNFFTMEVLTSDNNPVSYSSILDQLKSINENSHKKGHNIGVLTFVQNCSGKYYNLLSKNEKNRAILDEIEKSLFVISLDKQIDNRKKYGNILTLASKQYICGGEIDDNIGNRWFHKTMQLNVGMDGFLCISTSEHSPLVGQPSAMLLDHIVNYVSNEKHKDFLCENSLNVEPPRILKFEIDLQIKTAIESVLLKNIKFSQNLDSNIFHFTEFGKDLIKSRRLSPNSFIQIAIQYAYYRIHEKPGVHFETISTIRDTPETVRACSSESISFCKKMINTTSTASEKIEAFKNAISFHKEYSVHASRSIGIDRHLLGLRLAAQELGRSIPKLFKDVAFIRSSRDHIITSQVATKSEGVMCYAPGVLDGYGCCYNLREQDMFFALSCFKDSGKDSSNFKEALEKSLLEINDLLK